MSSLWSVSSVITSINFGLEFDRFSDVTPYLSREGSGKLIADSASLLYQNGLFYFSTMEDDYIKSGYENTSFSGRDRVYIYYDQAEYLSKCIATNGFEVVDLQRKDYSEPDGAFLTDMIFIARKKY